MAETHPIGSNTQALWFTSIVGTTALTIVITIVSLSYGFHQIFPLLYLFPVILVAYRYPRFGTLFSLFLGSIYLGLVFFFGLSDLIEISISTAWFYVVVSVGVVMSSLSRGMRREEGKYRSIFNSSQTGLLVVDSKKMKIKEANPTAAKILGYKQDELKGAFMPDIWPDGGDIDRFLGRMNELFNHYDAEVRLRDKRGSIHHVLLSASVLEEDLVVCSFIDITERRAIEEKLFESELKFRNIVEKSLSGVYMIQDGRYIYANPTFAGMHGLTVQSLMKNHAPKDLVFEGDRGKFAEMERHYQRMDLGPFHYEMRHRRADGEVIYIEAFESIAEYRGRPAIMGTAIDITEKRRNRDALKSANEKLHLMSELTRHDLLNQITAAMGFVALALEESEKVEAREFLERANMVMKRMHKLLAFTSDYQNLGVQAPVWMDVYQAFMNAASAFSSPLLTYSVSVGELQLYADPLLEKVFYNLIENSISHGGNVKRIELRYEDSASGLTLVYSDDGEGISAERKEEIFRRSTSSQSGYGLFLCRQILSLTQMSMVETGEYGRGARFEIFVPKGNYRFMEPRQSAERTALGAGS